jgi:hypothetical protein
MTSSQLRTAARTTAPARPAEPVTEPDIKALWEPLLELLNGSPSASAARVLSRRTR